MRPEAYFDSFDDARSVAAGRALDNYALKLLKRHFTWIAPALLDAVWRDRAVEDKLEELRHRLPEEPLLQGLRFAKYTGRSRPRIKSVLTGFSQSEAWSDALRAIDESPSGRACLVFDVPYWSAVALHNYPRVPDEVPGKARVFWPGKAGVDLTMQPLSVFVSEYGPGKSE